MFVGTSAAGLQDIRATPFDAVYPGVEVHAAVVDAILNQDHIVQPDATPGIQALAILLAGLAAALVFSFTRAFIYGPACLLLAGGAIWGSGHLFAQGQFISPLYVVLTILAQGICILPVRFWQEERQKRVLRQAFSRYVAPEVVARIAAREGDIFAGEERDVSVLFTDIRGFTSLSEKLEPQQVVALLNRYFTPMTACVRDSGGTLDKFIGDAIMAFWNAPLDVPDHPRRAVAASVRMQAPAARAQSRAGKGIRRAPAHRRGPALRAGLRGQYGVRGSAGLHLHRRHGQSGLAPGGHVRQIRGERRGQRRHGGALRRGLLLPRPGQHPGQGQIQTGSHLFRA